VAFLAAAAGGIVRHHPDLELLHGGSRRGGDRLVLRLLADDRLLAPRGGFSPCTRLSTLRPASQIDRAAVALVDELAGALGLGAGRREVRPVAENAGLQLVDTHRFGRVADNRLLCADGSRRATYGARVRGHFLNMSTAFVAGV
jgi:hypothetical protein